MNLTGIIHIAGKSGLYKALSKAPQGLLAENLSTNKKEVVLSTSKVSTLSDISIYTNNGDNILLKDILETLYTSNNKAIIAISSDAKELQKMFEAAIPNYDKDRVYASDMKKVFNWYNSLVEKGLIEATEEEETQETQAALEDLKTDNKSSKNKATSNTTAGAGKTSKGSAKIQTVRKMA